MLLAIDCSPPFGASPNCFTEFGFLIASSTACAIARARLWNLTDVTQVADAAQTVVAIQDACSAVTTKVPPGSPLLQFAHVLCSGQRPVVL